jgi:hypothetical protein
MSNLCEMCELKDIPDMCDIASCEVHDTVYAQRLRCIITKQKNEIKQLKAIIFTPFRLYGDRKI